MPLYEYACHGCSLSFEELVRAGSTDPVNCPRCRSANVARQLSTFAAHGMSDGSTRIADTLNRGGSGGGGGGACGSGGCGHC
ncbi:MAG: FmdB family zinc ribbon protein [Myxococcales bacterium]